MTQIAQDYHISRTFLYQLMWAANLQLETLFSQQFPLSLQGECSPCELHWHFVNFDAKIPPDLHDVIFS
jgi:hypothetical protein